VIEKILEDDHFNELRKDKTGRRCKECNSRVKLAKKLPEKQKYAKQNNSTS
jgi:hypothetical protein